ncbi:hypothetical protein AB0N79_38740 [Streptomyces microflavus]|uniref:hypothetical protein n=1 Tax=Streptomyces microflavus TaxID=1919 RepID=UPI00343C9674
MDRTALPETMTIAPAVAAGLGPDWTCQSDEERHRGSIWITRPEEGRGRGRGTAHLETDEGDRRRIRLFIDHYASGSAAGRIHAHGRCPDQPDDVAFYDGDIGFGSITVAGTKTPRQIAAEIRRRLMPQLESGLSLWHERLEEARAKEARGSAVAQQLAAVPGMTAPTRASNGLYGNDRPWHLSWSGRSTQLATPRAAAEVSSTASGTHVRLELSQLTGAQAERVLRALVEACERGSAD